MSDEDIQRLTPNEHAILRRCEEATPGPWYYLRDETDRGYQGHIRDTDFLQIVSRPERRDDLPGDMLFIAHARQDIPALLQALVAARWETFLARSEIADLEGVLGDLQQDSLAYRMGQQQGAAQQRRLTAGLLSEMRRYFLHHGLLTGECVAWNRLKQIHGLDQEGDAP